MGSDFLRSENETRANLSPMKLAIANNHGTIFQSAWENMDNNKIRPLYGDDFWHLKKDTPKKNPFRQTMQAPDVVSLATENWRFWAYRDDLPIITYEQPDGVMPQWASALAAITPIIGQLDYIQAEKVLYS